MSSPFPPPGGDATTDAALVAAHLAGDRTALATIYDRHAAALYDTASAMLRDRHEAADVLQDVFLVAAQRLDQLRDPERLKPWLFAVLRNEVFRRTKRRGRQMPVDFSGPGAVEMAAPDDPGAGGAAVMAADLGALLREAARGLDERDQLVLELTARQGLAGEELADALGVTTEQSYVLVHRMRERVERSLGALTVARMGRKDCPVLADLLRDWDGRFSVLIRKRVARHVDSCERCERTRTAYAILPLIGAAPAVAPPAGLREQVLGHLAAASARPAYRFEAPHGFPTPVARATRPAVVVAIAAVAILLLLALTALVVSGGDDGGAAVAPATAVPTTAPATDGPVTVPSTSEPPPTPLPTTAPDTAVVPTTAPATVPATTVVPTTVPATTVPATAPPVTTVAPTAPPPSPSTTVASPPPPPATTVRPIVPGRLVLSSTLVDLGTGSNQTTFSLRNDGEQPLSWSAATGGLAPFSIAPTGGQIAPGGSTLVQVALDRTGLTEGDLERVLSIASSADGGGQVMMLARTENPPIIRIRNWPTVTTTCSIPVELTAVDDTGVAGVSLAWSGPGPSGSRQMARSGDQFDSTITGFGDGLVDGTWTVTATATDLRKNTTSVTRQVEVLGCTIIG